MTKLGTPRAPGFDETFLRKLERLSVVAKRAVRESGRGERATRRGGAGLEFADHREYAQGDDLRRLDWNLFGRLERPLVRLYDEDEDLPLYVLVDHSASMAIGNPPKLSLAAQTAAALAYVALSALDRVAVYPMADGLGTGLGPQRGKGQIHAVLALLSGLSAAGRTDLAAAIDGLLARHRRRGMVILLSDFFDPQGFERALDRLRHARFEPAVIQLTAPEEIDPPVDTDVILVDVETKEERLVAVTPATRAAYLERFQARLAGMQSFCRRHAVACVQVSSTHPFDDLVLRVLRAQRLLA